MNKEQIDDFRDMVISMTDDEFINKLESVGIKLRKKYEFSTVDEVFQGLTNKGSCQEKINFEIASNLFDIIYAITSTRIDKGISQKQLANLVNISKSKLIKIERLDEMPKIDLLIKIYKHLGLKLKIVDE